MIKNGPFAARFYLLTESATVKTLPLSSNWLQARQTKRFRVKTAKKMLTLSGHLRIMRPATPMKVTRKKMAT